MNIIEKANMQSFHEHRLNEFGDLSVKSLGWKNTMSQQKRFEMLIQIGDLNGTNILDLGCGYGDLKPFLDEHFENFTYIGVEHMPDFFRIAQENYGDLKDTYFVQGDFSKMTFEDVDYILASGALGYKCQNEVYYWETIAHMIKSANKGVAFNMLDETKFPEHNLLKAHNKSKVVDFCSKLCNHVQVIDNYLEDDFTVFALKEK